MHKTEVIIFGLLLTLVSGARAESFITKQNQASNNCNLAIAVSGLPDWRDFTLTIPKDDPRPKGIFSIYLVIGTNGSPVSGRVMAPLQIEQKQDGSRFVRVHIGRDLLDDVFLSVDYLESPIAPLQTIKIKLASYVPVEGRGRINGANQAPEDIARKPTIGGRPSGTSPIIIFNFVARTVFPLKFPFRVHLLWNNIAGRRVKIRTNYR